MNIKRLLLKYFGGLITKKASKKANTIDGTPELLVAYYKGPCLGKCPVYDLKIYNDRTLTYTGLKHVPQKNILTSVLTSDEFASLVISLDQVAKITASFTEIRDLPLTILIYNNKKFSYHASMVDGDLLAANKNLEGIVNQLYIAK